MLIGLRHIVGAPQPDSDGGTAPAELESAFVIASLIANAIFWLALGALSGFLFERLGARPRTGPVLRDPF